MDSVAVAELARAGVALVVQTISSVRERQEASGGSGALEALQAVALLFCMALLPTLVRVRILYTFCWAGFTVLAHLTGSEPALGLATSLGLTIMLGWYSLRAVVDRSTFSGILQGWFGFLSKFPPFRLLANSVDLLLHMMVPLVLALCYLPLVRLWMTAPILVYVGCSRRCLFDRQWWTDVLPASASASRRCGSTLSRAATCTRRETMSTTSTHRAPRTSGPPLARSSSSSTSPCRSGACLCTTRGCISSSSTDWCRRDAAGSDR